MSSPYGTLTGMDYSGKKNKIMAPESAVPAEKIQTRTKYEKYSEKPEIQTKTADTPQNKEKTDEMVTPKAESKITPLKLFAAFFLLACLMIVWTYETTSVREGLLEIEQLKDAKLELEKTNESIQVDITKLSDYQRIEKIATEKLKMVPSKEKPGVIFLDPEKVKTLNQKQELSKEH
jgi:cell division protein FtsL